MDKQIIIDGVDVSGCSCYVSNGECVNKDVYPDYCKACSNCTYKLEQQLKRKEQELQEAMDNYVKLDNQRVKEYNELVDLYKAKEQECKDLKEDIKDIANLLDLDTGEEYNFGNIELEIKQLKSKEQECEKWKKYGCFYLNKFIQLKQTLTEIKEIATKIIEDYDGNQATNMQEDAKEILQKISECEGNDE